MDEFFFNCDVWNKGSPCGLWYGSFVPSVLSRKDQLMADLLHDSLPEEYVSCYSKSIIDDCSSPRSCENLPVLLNKAREENNELLRKRRHQARSSDRSPRKVRKRSGEGSVSTKEYERTEESAENESSSREIPPWESFQYFSFT